jgi:hypothetical protein
MKKCIQKKHEKNSLLWMPRKWVVLPPKILQMIIRKMIKNDLSNEKVENLNMTLPR